MAAAAEAAQAAAASALEATQRDGSTADNPAATAPPGPANPGGEVKKEEAEETYERDATELLGAFKADEEPPTKEEAVDAEALLKQFMLDMKDVDRDNEVTRVLGAFKLNPFEKLNLRFTATAAEVKRAYRCRPPALPLPTRRNKCYAAHQNKAQLATYLLCAGRY